MNDGVALLTATSNFLSYRRFENVFKSVCTDAGKEVARSKKVMDNDEKEYTLFLAPKPIKGKPLDSTKMFGGQIQHLFKQVETSSKCGKHMDPDKKKSSEVNATCFRRFRQDFRSRRADQRGGRFVTNFQNRGRGQRQSFGWNDGNRPFKREVPAQKPFPRPGNK